MGDLGSTPNNFYHMPINTVLLLVTNHILQANLYQNHGCNWPWIW